MARNMGLAEAGFGGQSDSPMGEGWRQTKYPGFMVKDGGAFGGGEELEAEQNPEALQTLGESAIAAYNQSEMARSEMVTGPKAVIDGKEVDADVVDMSEYGPDEQFKDVPIGEAMAARSTDEFVQNATESSNGAGQLQELMNAPGGLEEVIRNMPPLENETAADWLRRVAMEAQAQPAPAAIEMQADVSELAESGLDNEPLAIEMKSQLDRNGNPLYKQATIERAVRSGMEMDPQAREAIEAQARARVEALHRERDEIEKAMAGRSEQEFLQDQSGFIKELADERSKIAQEYKYEQNPQMKEYLQRQLDEIEKETTAARAMFERASRYFAEVTAQSGEKLPEEKIEKQAAGGALEELGRQVGTATPEVIVSHEEEVQAGELPPVPGELYMAPDQQEIIDLYEKALSKHEGKDLGEADLQDPEKRESKVLAVFEKLKNKAGTAVRRASRKILLGMAMMLSTGALVGCSPNSKAATVSANQPKVATEMDATTGADMKAERITLSEADAMANPDYVSPAEFSAEDTRQVAENGTRYDYTAEYLSNEKLGINNFGRDHTADYGDREATVSSIYQVCYEQPEVLAAHVANFPSVLKSCGIELEPTLDGGHIDPRIIDDMLSNGENGQELQKKLLEAYKDQVLNNKDTQFQFYQEYKNEEAYYMLDMRSDKSEAASPKNMGISSVPMQRNGAYEVRVGIVLSDGTVEYADYKYDCGYQSLYEKITEFAPTDQNTETPIINTTPEGVPVVTPENPTDPSQPKEPKDDPKNDKEKKKKPETTPTPTDEPEITPTPTDEPEPSVSPTPSPTPEPSPSPSPSPTPEPSPTPGPSPTPNPTPAETLAPKDPNKGSEILNNGNLNDGNLTQTEDVNGTGVGETTESSAIPEEGNYGAVDNGAVTDSQEDANNQQNAENEWSQDSGMTEGEQNNYIDNILQQTAERKQQEADAEADASETQGDN